MSVMTSRGAVLPRPDELSLVGHTIMCEFGSVLYFEGLAIDGYDVDAVGEIHGYRVDI